MEEKVFAYGESSEIGEYVPDVRWEVSYISLCRSMAQFVRRVLKHTHNSKRWVDQRTTETGNPFDIVIAHKHPGCLIIKKAWSTNVLKILNCKGVR